MAKKVSVVVITKNEELNVEKCLNSIAGVADELLVADTGSTDKTVGLAITLGAKVIHLDWKGYSATKNLANQHAENDWILSLDADEQLSDELKKSLEALKGSEEFAFGKFNRRQFFMGKWIRHGGWYPDTKVRFFNRLEAKWVGDFVHEKLAFNPSIKVIHLEGDCVHYPINSLDELNAQAEKYSTLAAKDRLERGKKAGFFQIYIYPVIAFINFYVIRRGFLDGKEGLILAKSAAKVRYLRARKMND